MYKKLIISNGEEIYATDCIETALEKTARNEAVIFVCNNIEETPIIPQIKYITDDLESCDEEYLHMIYSRQKGLPLTILETERTFIREITLEDLPELYNIYDDDAIREYIEPLYNYEEERDFTEKYIENMYGVCGYGLWVITDKQSGKVIGRAGIENREIDGELCYEIGYVVRREYRNIGIATEVCTAITEYAFDKLGMDQLFIVCHRRNEASIAVAKHLGFEYYAECENGLEEKIIFIKRLNYSEKCR